MKMSQLFGKTLRQDPAEAETPSHRLLLKAGMISQLTAGAYTLLPLGRRAYRKIETVVREEMDAAGSQELVMPTLQPLELWEESGRAQAFGQILFRLKDRRERDLVLGPTHEEVITHLVRQHVRSYRDLPLLLYQIQTKFRDEPRPRGGLLRVREFAMKDLYSFDADEAGLDISYQKMVQAYTNIFRRCGLSAIPVEADSGAIGGKDSQEFILFAESGEDQVLTCTQCGYAANAERATSIKPPVPQGPALPLEEVRTPGRQTIEAVAGFLGMPRNQTLKAVFYSADGRPVFVLIRGDLEVNEVKLKNTLHCNDLRLATDQEVKEAGLVAGYASPVGLHGVQTVGDESITTGANFVAGANRPNYHLKNVNHPRDFQVEVLTDIARAEAGHGCPRCQGTLQSARGIEVGHVFKLGVSLSQKLGAYYLDREGVQQPMMMGCYGIGIGRLLAAAVEQHHDDRGMLWPPPIAPFQVHLVGLNLDTPQVADAAESLYATLQQEGLEVLYDDREESAGVKFNDADLLGMPLRLTVSPRTMKQQGVEVKKRKEKDTHLIPLEGAAQAVKEILANY